MSDTASATPTKDAIDHAGGAAFDPSRPHRTRDGREVMGLKPHLQGLTGRLQGEDTNHWWHLNGRFFLAKEDCLDLVNDPASPVTPLDERGGGDAEPVAFQVRVEPWLMACFGPEVSGDREERNHRFLEEALELVQACGCTASEAHQLVDYTFARDVGDPRQETGGVMVTLAALCLANGLDMHEAAEVELTRIWTKVEKIRAKQAAKPKYSPLPMVASEPTPTWLPSILSRHGSLGLPEDPREAVGVLVDAYAEGQNAVQLERERLHQLMWDHALSLSVGKRTPWIEPMGVVRRGRFLTEREKLQNLADALDMPLADLLTGLAKMKVDDLPDVPQEMEGK